jgi:cysteine-rich repeat protein
LTGLIGPSCGDGILQAPEECDLGTGNGAMSDCSLMCKHNLCHPMVSDLVIQKELIQHTGTCANMTGDLVFKLHYSNVGSGTVS